MARHRSSYCIILLSALVTCTGNRDAAAVATPAFRVSDLGTLGEISYGYGINAHGQVTGYSDPTDGGSRAFLWTPTTPNGVRGTMHDLGTLGGTSSFGLGINDSSHVTGYSFTTGDGATHAFLYDGTMHDLGTLGGTLSAGHGINASGQVVGDSSTAGDDTSRAFLFDGAMKDLGTLGGRNSRASGINASGQVTGLSTLSTANDDRAFLWTPTTPNGTIGTMHDLGTLGGRYSVGEAINAGGQVTGVSATSGNSNPHAFLYDGTMHDLGTLGGTYSDGEGINASGQVTGNSYTTGDAADHAFLYTADSGMVDLNSLIDPLSGWELVQGNAINDAGQITGWGLINGEGHAFLLTPVPEPASTVVLFLGAISLLAWTRWRRNWIVGIDRDRYWCFRYEPLTEKSGR